MEGEKEGKYWWLTPKFKHPNKLIELNKLFFMTIMSQILEEHISRYIYASINM